MNGTKRKRLVENNPNVQQKLLKRVPATVVPINNIIVKPPPPQQNNSDKAFTGQFGWSTLDEHYIPFILRNGEKFCAVRMVENAILSFLSRVSPEVYKDCIRIPSFIISEEERKLLTEINSFHCNYQYGPSEFDYRELLIRLEDVTQFYKFLDVCNRKISNAKSSDECGFTRIQKNSIVPYIKYKEQKYFPLFYFDGVQNFTFKETISLSGWDLSYLKLCFKIQHIRDEFLKQEECVVINYEEVKELFEPGTAFEDYWLADWSKEIINKNGFYRASPKTIWFDDPQV